jgi:NADH-quinone oxidoreductase subunit L
MALPLVVLAIGAASVGYLGVPEGLSGGKISNYFERLLEPTLGTAEFTSNHRFLMDDLNEIAPHVAQDHSTEITLTVVSSLIAISGIALGWWWFKRRPLWEPPSLLEHKYYVDEVYDAAVVQPIKQGSINVLWKFIDVRIIDGAVNGAGQLAGLFGGTLRYLQSGLARSYVALVVLGALLIIGYFVIR